jgi:hypothetical protein
MALKLATFAILMLSGIGLAQAGHSSSPFSRQDEQLLSSVWPTIREARDFDDIDWRSVGLARPPGNSSAQRLMADNWSRLRTAPRFADIDWSNVRDSRDYAYNVRDSRDHGYDARDYRDHGYRTTAQHYDEDTGPFTRDEARQLSAVWSKIRQANSFADIDWRAVGMSHAPGDRQAQAFVTAHWDSLRRAERFEDIDWRRENGDR